jgi:hypothetical protein
MTQREYRGKDIVTGEWLRGGFYQNSNDDKNWIITHGDMDEYFEASVVDPDTVGQYTGLDSSEDEGYKLFRGDILSMVDENNEKYIVYIEIEGPLVLLVSDRFADGYELASEFMDSLDGNYWIPGAEKIGNRWDHPHLLNKAE